MGLAQSFHAFNLILIRTHRGFDMNNFHPVGTAKSLKGLNTKD